MFENQRIQLTFKDVSERDMDILFLEEFAMSKEFCRLFLNKVGVNDFEIVSLEHSKMDNELGESDIAVVYTNAEGKHGILVEDKIDAEAQPNQYERYVLRGEKGVKNGEFDDYEVFIVAPENYLETNEAAREHYQNKVSYEEILDYFSAIDDARSRFKIQQIEQAIRKEKQGYTVIVNEQVTDFWNAYFEYQKAHYNHLDCRSKPKSKGSKALWAEYATETEKFLIIHKTDKGCVDLQISLSKSKAKETVDIIKSSIPNYATSGFHVSSNKHSRKSDLATIMIRRFVPIVDVKQSFDSQKEKIEESFAAVEKLKNLEDTIDMTRFKGI